jgi:serine/threonine protein kinase/ABC-type sulfate transport system substrate-binding protein
MAGNMLNDRYRIVEILTKGNFSTVYKARDEYFSTKPIVALKEMSYSQLGLNEKAKAHLDFRNEAGLLVQLKHPHLPTVSDFFEVGEKTYLVMEFIEGKTLAQIQVEQNGPLDERLVMGWAMQLCTVLHYLHAQPRTILFRDMRPTNVMVTANGEIKLIDFGIARIFNNRDTTMPGSQSYAPLEQYARGQSDARSDIYALGATLYDLLTKEMPIDASSRRMNSTLFTPPRRLNPYISPTIEAVILKAMAQDPQDRYQTAAGMYRAIASAGLTSTSGPLSFRNGVFDAQPSSQSTTNPATRPSKPLWSPSSPENTLALASGPSPSTTNPVTHPSRPLWSPSTLENTLATPSGPSSSISGPTIRPTTPPRVPAISGDTLATPSEPSPSSTAGRTGQGGQRTRRAFLIGGVAAVGAGIVGGTLFFFTKNIGNTLNLNFTYSTEKQAWMQDVINDFNNSNTKVGNRFVQIQGDPRGSVDATTRILNGQLKPGAWSPASDLELNRLLNNWKKQYGSQDIVYTSGEMGAQDLVLSPLVFAAWKERSDLLTAKYQTIGWPAVHDALQLPGWSRIGGQASWGPVKFGQTRADSSNSGLLSITLLAYSFYRNISRALSVDKIQNADFLKYFSEVEDNVQRFGRSSGTYLQNEVLVQGPSQYDIVTTYENLVLTLQKTAQQRQHEALVPSYPNLNIVSNHPFAIFTSAPQDEQMAAKKFRDFLLDVPQQRKALLSGFRPINPHVSLHDSITGNPFTDPSLGFHVPEQLPIQVQAPNGDVTDELLKQWSVRYNMASTSLSFSTKQNTKDGVNT